jgi:hypothetical protein
MLWLRLLFGSRGLFVIEPEHVAMALKSVSFTWVQLKRGCMFLRKRLFGAPGG